MHDSKGEIIFLNQIEYLKEKLYIVLRTGNYNDILEVSIELDKLIVAYMKASMSVNKKTS
jgi:hypothetical protein